MTEEIPCTMDRLDPARCERDVMEAIAAHRANPKAGRNMLWRLIERGYSTKGAVAAVWLASGARKDGERMLVGYIDSGDSWMLGVEIDNGRRVVWEYTVRVEKSVCDSVYGCLP